jgi:hypothetical protein
MQNLQKLASPNLGARACTRSLRDVPSMDTAGLQPLLLVFVCAVWIKIATETKNTKFVSS